MNCVGHLWAGCEHSHLTIEIYRGGATGHPRARGLNSQNLALDIRRTGRDFFLLEELQRKDVLSIFTPFATDYQRTQPKIVS